MVKWFSIYACFVVTSFFLSNLWGAMSFPSMSPQSFPITAYQKIIGTKDGIACHSYPVCTVYARHSFEKYGLLFGSWLMIDRLIHEGDDLAGVEGNKNVIMVEGVARSYDPLSRNAGWLGDD